MAVGTETRGQTAFVTGGTSGIGRAIACALAEIGCKVVATGRSEQALDELRSTPGISPLGVDVADRDGLRSALSDVDVDILVNNAGIMPATVPFAEMDQAEIDATLEVNLMAAITVTRMVLPGMLERQRGHLFFTGSIAGQTPFPNMAVYGASKAAISSFAESLRCDLAGTGLRVTEIVAGRVETQLYRMTLDLAARRKMYGNGAAVLPEDVARMVVQVLDMPRNVDVTRFDILPTAQFIGGGGYVVKEE